MFSSTLATGPRKPYATAYVDVSASTAVDSASPHKLVSLLYASLAAQIIRARGALARRDVGDKGLAIRQAVRIIEEGLDAPLDMHAGGALAQNLHDLYQYLVQRLTQANLRSDGAVLEECARLVDTLREGWDGIAEQARSLPRVAT